MAVISVKHNSNTTLVKVKQVQDLIDVKPTCHIQIQHLLKLNDIIEILFIWRFFIQIQHLLKLNCRVRLCPMCQWRIQIQHLLKLNGLEKRDYLGGINNSNTTLVKVK